MRYPKFLKENDTIGFVAPAFGCTTEPYKSCFENALRIWKEQGYQLLLGPNCYADNGIGISNTPRACGNELTKMYCTNDSDVLISCGGGELMCEILDHVDFGMMKRVDPKWFMGYSDNTNFTFLLTTICDVASIYGSNAPAFGAEPWHVSNTEAMELLTGKRLLFSGYSKWEKESLKTEENPLAPLNLTEDSVIQTFPEGDITMKGRLLGGCLDCLVTLIGTNFDRVREFNKNYAQDGVIWFLEACDLSLVGMRRALWQLGHAGWFDNCKGFVIGRPLHFDEDSFGLNRYSAVSDILAKYKVPILFDADIGHLAPRMPIVCGSMATVKTSGNSYTIEMELC